MFMYSLHNIYRYLLLLSFSFFLSYYIAIIIVWNFIHKLENNNNPAIRALEIASFNGYGTARSMAKVSSMIE